MSNINWDTSAKDVNLIAEIASRAVKRDKALDKVELMMDITATHNNGTPLDLKQLLNFDKFNFAHDIYGIIGHINRNTGKLERCFLPRCAASVDAAAQ